MQKAVPALVLISSACRRFGIPATRFGREAVNDPNLVQGLREGRQLRAATTEAILAYIAALDPTPKARPALTRSAPRTRPKCVNLPAEMTYADHCVMMRRGSAKLLSAILAARGEC